MYINERYQSLGLMDNIPCQYIERGGACRTEEGPILTEHLMEVYINGRLSMKLICTPEYLAELALGRLLTEGMIKSAEEVEQIYVCERGTRARILLKDSIGFRDKKRPFTETTPSCCTGNHILDDYFVDSTPPQPVVPIPWEASQVFALADHFAEGMPLHSRTWATHSCFLSQGSTLLFQCEDIGRHNALDKAIGFALRSKISLSSCMVYSSGRIPTDMAMKAIRAGIPILASKASPSREAVSLAEEYGLTLVCAARQDRMKLFAGMPPSDMATGTP